MARPENVTIDDVTDFESSEEDVRAAYPGSDGLAVKASAADTAVIGSTEMLIDLN